MIESPELWTMNQLDCEHCTDQSILTELNTTMQTARGLLGFVVRRMLSYLMWPHSQRRRVRVKVKCVIQREVGEKRRCGRQV